MYVIFQLLCALLARQGPKLSAEKSMEMLEFMHFFGLDSDHPAARVFLQLAMENTDDFGPLKIRTIVYTRVRQTRAGAVLA